MKYNKTRTWVKVLKRVVGFTTLYLLLVLLILWIQHVVIANNPPEPDWSFLTTFLKVSKFFTYIAGFAGLTVGIIFFFVWCFGGEEE